jgi:ribosomal protein S6 kinase alpha-5
MIINLDYVSGGELFTHLNKRQHFSEQDARMYIAELTLALGQLHKVNKNKKIEIKKEFLFF